VSSQIIAGRTFNALSDSTFAVRDLEDAKKTYRDVLGFAVFAFGKESSGRLASSSEGMRDLINRALLERGDQLLKPIEALIQRASVVYQQDVQAERRTDQLREAQHRLETVVRHHA
jgi:catechol 2,3-dioxygenase-like lactoylglutathione lyase family enzyme